MYSCSKKGRAWMHRSSAPYSAGSVADTVLWKLLGPREVQLGRRVYGSGPWTFCWGGDEKEMTESNIIISSTARACMQPLIQIGFVSWFECCPAVSAHVKAWGVRRLNLHDPIESHAAKNLGKSDQT